MIFRNPNSYEYTDKTLWLHIKPMKLESQASLGRLEPIVTIAPYEFAFLMPNDFQESVEHDWSPYESMIGRIAEMITTFRKEWKSLGNASVQLQETYSAIKARGKFTETDWNNLKRTVANTMAGTAAVSNYRLDFPLVYKNSERRRFDVSVTLINCGTGYDCVLPVKKLMALSSPGRSYTPTLTERQSVADPKDVLMAGRENRENADLVDIELPSVFQVWTHPEKTIYFKYAAMRAIQPTYRGPFIRGYPSSCELMLSFVDLEPLFSDFVISDKTTYKDTGKSWTSDVI